MRTLFGPRGRAAPGQALLALPPDPTSGPFLPLRTAPTRFELLPLIRLQAPARTVRSVFNNDPGRDQFVANLIGRGEVFAAAGRGALLEQQVGQLADRRSQIG